MAAEVDIAPALLEKAEKAFAKGVRNNKAIVDAAGKINLGRGSFRLANAYAEQMGKEITKAVSMVLTPDQLPNGRLYYNIANRVVKPLLEDGYDDVGEITAKVVDQLNSKAGIGMKAVRPKTDMDRIDNLIWAIGERSTYEEAAALLGEPVINLMQSAVDETGRENAEVQYESGLRPKIVRTASANCCEWCDNLAGTYDYPVDNTEVYQRHLECRCVVEFEPGRGAKTLAGARQNVHSKKWSTAEQIAERIKYGL